MEPCPPCFAVLTAEELCDRLCRPEPTLILFHARPDADAVGSAFALRELLADLGIPAWCLCADELPHRLAFMGEAVQPSVLPGAVPAAFASARAVAVDTASPSQLGALYEPFAGRVDCMIDHHGRSTPYADHYTLPTASATGELIWQVYTILKERGLPVRASRRFCALLYAAISSDTGSFRHSNTTPATLRLAATLLEQGIDTAAIVHRLYECKPVAQLQVDSQIGRLLRLHADGRAGILPFSYALKTELGIRDEHLETLVDAVRVLEGVRVACSIRQPDPEGVFRVSMRSSCALDVAAICARFGGGGHVKAAGCTVQAGSIEEAESIIAAALCEGLAELPAEAGEDLGDFAAAEAGA